MSQTRYEISIKIKFISIQWTVLKWNLKNNLFAITAKTIKCLKIHFKEV